jgi:hypothetical protein
MKKLAALAFLLSAAAIARETDFPTGYRDWIYLTSGMDMSYNPSLQMQGQHMFDNVFVDPQSYRDFLKSGTWPDHTRLVLESRDARTEGSINKAGMYQSGEPMAVEMHMKDATLPGGWAFYAFGTDSKPVEPLPQDANCYACHKKDGAVDTTFVQFYPTLLPIAQAKRTMR